MQETMTTHLFGLPNDNLIRKYAFDGRMNESIHSYRF
jgi:hypothetical protein